MERRRTNPKTSPTAPSFDKEPTTLPGGLPAFVLPEIEDICRTVLPGQS